MNSLDKFRTPSTNKSMGIEIECLFDNGLNVPIDDYVGFFYFTTDGSIEATNWDQYGREIVSQPLSAPWLKKEIQKLGKKFSWSENRSCGIHVHVSRQWLSKKKAEKILEFLRGLSMVDYKDLFGRIPNDYCSLHTRYTGYRQRYMAINMTNEKTIEFRMFKSGSPEWACYCVDMVQYLITNANTLNLSAITAFRDQYKF